MSIRQGNKIIAGNVDNADYTALLNKPQINSIELNGNKTLEELGIQAKGEYALKSELANKADKADTLAGYGITDGLSTSQITNCITKIPQDIHLELSDGTLTLKAGSKVYYLDGSSKIIQQDITTSTVSTTAAQRFLWVSGDSNFSNGSSLECYSGNNEAMNAIVSPKAYQTFYNTEQKKAFRGNGTNWQEQDYSLPIALVSNEPSVWTSIDQVFNGFGYIGNIIFALPDVEGLIPNGRNADCSLNSKKHITDSLKIVDISDYVALNKEFNLVFGYFSGFASKYTVQNSIRLTENKTLSGQSYTHSYVRDENQWYFYNKSITAWSKQDVLLYGSFHLTADGRITSFKPKTVFQAADRNDTEWASLSGKPSNRYIDLNLEASGSTYIAPVNGWICLDKATGTADTFMAIEIVKKGTSEKIYGTRHIAQNPAFNISDTLPVLKGEEFKVYYNMTGDTSIFRFIYDEGVK